MKITIIAGSHRRESESARVAQFIDSQLQSLGITDRYVLSLANNPLPLWDEGVWAGEPQWKERWQPIAAQLSSSQGFVVISPEWSGMVPPGLKNFFLLCGGDLLAHKPALIVGVSSGLGGSYPVNELRTSSYKNTRLCYIPDHVIVRNVATVLCGQTPVSDADEAIRNRLVYSLRVLIEYSRALCEVRASGVADYKSFPYGM